MFGARTQSTKNFFGPLHFKHHCHRYPTTALLACRVQWYGCLGRRPGILRFFLALCSLNTTILGTHKHFCWLVGYSGLGVWGATSEDKGFFGGIVQFKYHHHRYLKTTLLAYRVQLYGCLGRHARIQRIFFGIVQSRQPYHRYPIFFLLANRVHRCQCLARQPRTPHCKAYTPGFPRWCWYCWFTPATPGGA